MMDDLDVQVGYNRLRNCASAGLSKRTIYCTRSFKDMLGSSNAQRRFDDRRPFKQPKTIDNVTVPSVFWTLVMLLPTVLTCAKHSTRIGSYRRYEKPYCAGRYQCY